MKTCCSSIYGFVAINATREFADLGPADVVIYFTIQFAQEFTFNLVRSARGLLLENACSTSV